MLKGKGQAVITSEDSVTEFNNEPPLWKKAVAALTKPIWVSKAPAVVDDLSAGSDTEHIQPVPAKGLLKLKPASSKQAPPVTAHLPMKAPDSNNSNNFKRQKLPVECWQQTCRTTHLNFHKHFYFNTLSLFSWPSPVTYISSSSHHASQIYQEPSHPQYLQSQTTTNYFLPLPKLSSILLQSG